MRSYNIHISRETKQELSKIKNKYKLSISTITNIIIKNVNKETDIEKNVVLFNEYLDKQSKLEKTSIKPKDYNTYRFKYDKQNDEFNRFISNLLYLYCKPKEINKYLIPLYGTNWLIKSEKEMEQTKETYWNYNNQVRNQARAIKQNKEYYRRLLEQ